MKKPNKEQIAFIRGYACCVAKAIIKNGVGTYERELFKEGIIWPEQEKYIDEQDREVFYNNYAQLGIDPF